MSESAICEPGARERRKRFTRRELTAHARRLTAERGLRGFTIEELCSAVGVSRRTFFNYFPAKEDAVLGHQDDDIARDAFEHFETSRPEGCMGISPSLMLDLLDLAIAHMQLTGASPAEARELAAALDREPQLVASLLKIGAERERSTAELIARREGCSPDDQEVGVAVVMLSALLRKAGDDYFAPGNTTSFEDLLRASFGSAQALFERTPVTPV